MRWWVLGATIFGACDESVTFLAQKKEDTWQQSPTDQVDILWVVDNSNSMQLEQSLLAAGFTSFAQELENTNTNFHIGVVSTSFEYDDPDRGKLISEANCGSVIDKNTTCPNPDNPSEIWDYINVFTRRAQVGLNGSGKEKGLEVAEYALQPAMATGPNAGFLRDEANLLVVIVSDEEDCSDYGRLGNLEPTACYDRPDLLTPTSEFITSFSELKPNRDQFQLSAIVGPPNATSICDDTSIEGRRYIEVANATGGVTSSICETDWSDILYELGLNAAGIFTTFEMSHCAVDGTLEVSIDGEAVPVSPDEGYTYDDVACTISFHGLWVPERGANILAKYDIKSGT